MAKINSQEVGKGPIGRCRYQVIFDGRKATVNLWGYNLHAQESYKIKGMQWTQFDAGEVGNIIKRLAQRMEAIAAAVNKFGVKEYGVIKPKRAPGTHSRSLAKKSPLSKIQV